MENSSLHLKVNFEINGVRFNEFSECNLYLLRAIEEDICSSTSIEDVFKFPGIAFHFSPSSQLKDAAICRLVDIIDDNLGEIYLKNYGKKWKDAKKRELNEAGMVIVSITRDDSGQVEGFISFKMCFDADEKFVLYLYEIQLGKKLQGHGLGQSIMDQFHEYVASLQRSSNKLYQKLNGTALTVFSENERAFAWYTRLGYKFAECSPMDKTKRDGTVKKPKFYLMKRHYRATLSSRAR
ncbi:NAT4 [Candida oxycetoniae]|uniref:N-alpha-acetyltransferase 40 n=1 Tax=Candida oxycetoniae TaxID=497107 RepID=A0AAI9T0T5_9ASCO|nr:NAT4 [Candida oxycetoniae]KAI3406708.2 NAT4 [Candida oxycetoniae]